MSPIETRNKWANARIVKSGLRLRWGIVSGVAALLFAFLTVVNIVGARGSHAFRWSFITITLATLSILAIRSHLAARKKNLAVKTTDGLVSNGSDTETPSIPEAPTPPVAPWG